MSLVAKPPLKPCGYAVYMLWPQANAIFFKKKTLELTLFTEVGKKTASWIGIIAAILTEASSLQTTPADGTSKKPPDACHVPSRAILASYSYRWYSSSPAVQEWNGQDCLNSQDSTESSSKKKSNAIRESPTYYHSSLSRVLLNKQNSRTPYDLWNNNNYGGWKNKLDRASTRRFGAHCTANSCSDHILQGWRQHLVLTKPATEWRIHLCPTNPLSI